MIAAKTPVQKTYPNTLTAALERAALGSPIIDIANAIMSSAKAHERAIAPVTASNATHQRGQRRTIVLTKYQAVTQPVIVADNATSIQTSP